MSYSGQVTESEFQFIVVPYPAEPRPRRYTFRARWRLETEARTTAELRRPAEPGSGEAAIGTVIVNWRRTTGGPIGMMRSIGGMVTSPLRRGADRADADDPYAELDDMEINIDGLPNGQPVRLTADRAEVKALHWSFRGRPADWWIRIEVRRDGVPIPREVRRS